MSVLCWIDGLECSSQEELREHMVADHVLGVDYLKCSICGEVLVDMLSHYMAKHPGAEILGGMQFRITGKHYDWRRRYHALHSGRRGKRFKEGFFDSAKNGKRLHYRSGYEEKVYCILEKAFSVKSYSVEPFSIPYHFGGVSRNYWPDIQVVFVDGSIMIIEVKPLSQCPINEGNATIAQAINEAKWDAAQAYCHARGWDFVVWTENAIRALGRLRSDRLTKIELTK